MNSLKYPKIVYKYRDWTNKYHRELLTKCEVFLSSPKEFNDPFDCRISTNLGLLDTDEKKWNYSKNLGEKHKEGLKRKGLNVDQVTKDIFNRLKRDLNQEQAELEGRKFKGQDDHYGILSLSKRWDSILMWGHYASNHSGFCVGFHEQKLQNSGLFGSGGMVNYSVEFPQIDPLDDLPLIELGFIETHSKSSEWEYEEEYRLFKFYPCIPTVEQRKVKIDKSFYAEIYLGIYFPEDQLDVIGNLAKELNVPLFQVKRIPSKFKLDRVRLN